MGCHTCHYLWVYDKADSSWWNINFDTPENNKLSFILCVKHISIYVDLTIHSSHSILFSTFGCVWNNDILPVLCSEKENNRNAPCITHAVAVTLCKYGIWVEIFYSSHCLQYHLKKIIVLEPGKKLNLKNNNLKFSNWSLLFGAHVIMINKKFFF